MVKSSMPDLEALRVLREVVAFGSITRAASSLGRSQQAVSARIHALEEAVGRSLLVRSQQGVTPTEAGTQLLFWAHDVFTAASQLQADVTTLRASVGDPLRLATSRMIADYILSGWVTNFRAEEKEMGLVPTLLISQVASNNDVVELVRTGDVMLGFLDTFRIPADLETVSLGSDEVVTVVGPAHPWAMHGPQLLSLTDLASATLVLTEKDAGTHDAFACALASQQPPVLPPATVELGTVDAVRSVVIAGIAPGLLSRAEINDDLALGRVAAVHVDSPPILRPFTAIHRGNGSQLLGPAQRLIEAAKAGDL